MQLSNPETRVGSKISLSLEDLPTELIQEIAFLSFNPDIYLVSRDLRARLYPQREYLKDIAVVLFCDRNSSKSCWHVVPSIPWCTSPGRRYDLVPETEMRESLQQKVLNANIITAARLISMLRFVFDLWVDTRLPRLKSYQMDTLREHLHTTSVTSNQPVQRYNMFSTDKWRKDRFLASRNVVHVLHVPTRLLGPQSGEYGKELGTMLLLDATMDSLNHSIVKKYMATAKPKWMYT